MPRPPNVGSSLVYTQKDTYSVWVIYHPNSLPLPSWRLQELRTHSFSYLRLYRSPGPQISYWCLSQGPRRSPSSKEVAETYVLTLLSLLYPQVDWPLILARSKVASSLPPPFSFSPSIIYLGSWLPRDILVSPTSAITATPLWFFLVNVLNVAISFRDSLVRLIGPQPRDRKITR